MKTQYYQIGAKCIACGRCALVCPENCIHIGIPYTVDTDKCALCGTCFHVCPKGAVEKKEAAPLS